MTEADNRNAQRYPEALSVTYALLTDRSTTPIFLHETETVNISRRGARLLMPEPVGEHTLIQLCIRMPALRDPILMVSKVRWCRALEGGKHDVGVQFIGQLPPRLEELIGKMATLRQEFGVRPPRAKQ
jgi:hypothetical protein